MIEVKKEGVLLKKTKLAFENVGVLNPAAIREDDCVHLFYRAVSEDKISSIGYCKLNGPLVVEERLDKPLLTPLLEFELQGMEDPRIVKIEDLYYLTYTAYDGVNALGALAVSKDLIHFDRLGLIVPQITYDEFNRLTEFEGPINGKYLNDNKCFVEINGVQVFVWDKNVVFFPRKINGKFYFLHRIKPDIQIIVAIKNMRELTIDFWRNYFLKLDESIVLTPKYAHESDSIGGGCPPIETKLGWVLIYHGVHDSEKGFIFSACAALLDLENPQKEIARLPYPLFKPEEEWEKKGEANNVCFPTGSVLFGDTLYIYYGAANEQIACASVSITALLEELMRYKEN